MSETETPLDQFEQWRRNRIQANTEDELQEWRDRGIEPYPALLAVTAKERKESEDETCMLDARLRGSLFDCPWIGEQWAYVKGQPHPENYDNWPLRFRVHHGQYEAGDVIDPGLNPLVVIDGQPHCIQLIWHLMYRQREELPGLPEVHTLAEERAFFQDREYQQEIRRTPHLNPHAPRPPQYPREYDTRGSIVDGRPSVDELKVWLDYDGAAGVLAWKMNRGRAKAGSRVPLVPGSNQLLAYVRVKGRLLAVIDICWCLATGEWPIRRLKRDDGREVEYVRHINGNAGDIRAINLERSVPWEQQGQYGAVQRLSDFPWTKAKVLARLPDYLL